MFALSYESGRLIAFICLWLFSCSSLTHQVFYLQNKTFEDNKPSIPDVSKMPESILKNPTPIPEWKEADEVTRRVWLGA